jgi:hypothetical protein
MSMGRSAWIILAFILAVVLAVPQARGQCQWRLEGLFDISSIPRAQSDEIAFDGRYIYTLSTESSLDIYDIANPANPVQTSQLYLPADLHHLTLFSGTVLLKQDDLALYAIDVSNPQSPRIADVFEFNDLPFDGVSNSTGAFGVENGFVFFPTSEGIRILDVTDPADIRQIQVINLVGGTRGVSYVFNGLLRAFGIAGIQTRAFDVRDPAAPVAITHPEPGFFRSFDGDIAYTVQTSYTQVRVSAYTLPTPDTSVLVGEIIYPFAPGQFFCGIDEINFSALDGLGYLELYSEYSEGDDGCEYAGDFLTRLIDLSNPENMLTLGQAGRVPTAVVNGIGVYSGYFILIRDLADPVQPVDLGTIRFLQSLRNMHPVDRYLISRDQWAFAAHALDVSTPDTPSLVNTLFSTTLLDDMVGLGTFDRFVFVATEASNASNGVDDRTLSAYRVVGDHLELTGQATHPFGRLRVDEVAASDGFACVGTGTTVQVYSFDAGTLTWETEWFPSFSSSARALLAQGSFAYLLNDRYCEILDLTDPSQPQSVAMIYTGSRIADIADGYLYVVKPGVGLSIYDIKVPAMPFLVGTFSQWQLDGPLAVIDGIVCVASEDRIWFINATDPSNPFKISTRQMPDRTWGLEIVDGFLARSSDAEVRLYDLQTPSDLAVVSSAPTLDKPFGVSSFGDLALISDYIGGLHIFDVSDIEAPTEVGFYDTPDRAYETVVVNEGGTTLAFIADGSTGLIILDISDPGSPTLVSSLPLSDLALAVAVRDGYAYLGTRFDGLQIVDISNPAAPFLVNTVDTPGSAQSVTLDGDFAYVADGTAGVQVIDISNPAAPTIVGSIDTPQSARQVFVHGTVAYVPDRTTGLVALDISDPANPQLTSTLGGLGDARSVTLWGHLAFVADFDGAVHMVDVADPTDMQLLDSVPTPGTPRAIASDGPRLFAADGDAGLTVLEARPCWYIPCPADTNDDGLIDFFDIQVYLAAYADNDGLADWNNDGLVDFFDLQGYLTEFAFGCP